MKRTAKKLAALCTAALLTLSLAACAPEEEAPAPSPSDVAASENVLHLGVMYSTDIVPLAVMKAQELDLANGFSLDMQVFQSAKDRDAALQAGALDGVFTDYIGVCIYQNAGLDVKITGVTDGDYVLLAAPGSGIADLTQAAGASIAISENTLIEYTLDYLLEEAGFASDYLTKTVVPRIPDRLEMLREGQTPLGLLPDPFSTLAAESGAQRISSANEYGLYPAVMGFLQSSIDAKKDTLVQFYAAYDAAVDYVNATPLEEFEDVAIAGAGFPEELKGKIALPTFRKDVLPTEAELQSAIDWAAEKGLCGKSLKPAYLLCDLGR